MSDFQMLVVGVVCLYIVFRIYRHFRPALTNKQKQMAALADEYDRVFSMQKENLSDEAFEEVGVKVIHKRVDEPAVLKIVANGVRSMADDLDNFCRFYEDMDLAEIAAAKRFLHDRERFIKRGYLDDWKDATEDLFKTLLNSIPTTGKNSIFSSYFVDSGNVAELLEYIYQHVEVHKHLYPDLFEIINMNWNEAGQASPKDAVGMLDNRDMVEAFVGNISYFRDLFYLNVGFDIPEKYRLEHTHIVGGSGWGKTQLIQNMIANEMGGFCVIDSQGDMIDLIASRFDCVVLDVEDIDFPLALNLFDVQITGTGAEKEQLFNGTLELYRYIFGALLGADLTQKQGAVFGYIVRLMMEIPNATIHTLYEVMGHTGSGKNLEFNIERYRRYIDQLDDVSKRWFNERFCASNFNATREQILNRLDGIISNPTFSRIFSSPENKIDFFDIIQSGKILLVKTSKNFLGVEHSAIFGRFIIAMVLQAALRREKIPKDKRTPWYLYIDEAWEYFDDKVDNLLNQARKYGVPMVIAHQNLAQMTPKLQASAHSSTSIKIVGGLNSNDVRTFAGEMKCDKSELDAIKKTDTYAEWMCYVRNYDRRAVTCSYGVLEAKEELSNEKQAEIKERNRKLYARPANEVPEPEQPTSNKSNRRPDADYKDATDSSAGYVKVTEKIEVVDADYEDVPEQKGTYNPKQIEKDKVKQRVNDDESWD